MTGIINTGSFSRDLMPGIREHVGASYNRYADEYTKIFEVRKSNQNFEEDVIMDGMGPGGAVYPEGTDITYESMKQIGIQRYTNVDYGRGFIITRNAVDDNLYPKQAKAKAESLGHSMKQLKETVHANILNRANSSSYVGWDAVELSSSLHLNGKGGTYANELATAQNLSEASLEQALIDIGGFTDFSGLKIQAQGLLAVIPRQLEFEIQRILKSELKNDTAENAINVLMSGRYLPQGYTVNHFLSSSSKWFIKTNVINGLVHYERRPLALRNDTVFDSMNMKFAMDERYCAGWSDPKGMFFNGE